MLARLGYDSARAWKALLSSKAMELAENLKIHPDHLKWYAAFHNESHHPHVHMVCYNIDPKEGYLSKRSIRKMKSSLANEIFRQELIPLYGEKIQRRDDLKEEAAEEEKPWKYTEYRIGKMVAAGLGVEQDYLQAADWLTLSANEKYKYAQYFLGGLYYHGKGVEQNYETAFDLYTHSADQSFPYASFELGKMLRDGIGCLKNRPDADRRFREAFLGFVSLGEKGHDDKLQYRLGWMLLNGVGTEKDEAKAKEYFEKAATVGNPFACYQFAKLILSDETASAPAVEKVFGYLRPAVKAENPYAAYFLGKLYEKGQHVPQNTAEAVWLYTLSAAQGNVYAQFFLDHMDEFKDPSVLLAGTRLLHHISRVFTDNAPPLKPPGQRTDRKLLCRLREKKQAQGHARDDHKQTMSL